MCLPLPYLLETLTCKFKYDGKVLVASKNANCASSMATMSILLGSPKIVEVRYTSHWLSVTIDEYTSPEWVLKDSEAVEATEYILNCVEHSRNQHTLSTL